MTSNEEVKLATQLEQSLRRLAGQNGAKFSLPVCQLVSVTSNLRRPVSRIDENNTDVVSIDDLSHVSVGEGENVGLCVRLVFIDKLYAVCGDTAEAIKQWAEEVASTPISKNINNFPHVRFQRVSHKVKIQRGEIMMA